MNTFTNRAKILNESNSPIWLYGHVVESKSGTFIYTDIEDNGIIDSVQFVVDPLTVCIKVPNIKDTNGNEIYTKDIVKFTCKSVKGLNVENVDLSGEIIYDESSFGFVIKSRINDDFKLFDLYDYPNIEIIGSTVTYKI